MQKALSKLVSAISLLRLRQWTKNLLVFAAMMFTASFVDPHKVVLACAAFLAMCLASSAIYVLNDIRDVESDRWHPEKRFRPLPMGLISAWEASILGIVCLAATVGIGYWLGENSLLAIVFYLGLQIVYNLKTKQIPIADVFTVSLGFVVRAAIGAVAIGVQISGWLLLCTLTLALLLSLGKRRHEFILMGEGRQKSRASLAGYTQQTLDALVIFSACSSALFYGVYAIESSTAVRHPGLIVTVLFVFYGVARYLYLVFAKGEGGEPDMILLRDPHIIASVLLYIVFAVLAMLGPSLPYIETGGHLR